MPFLITFEDRKFRMDDLTLEEVVQLEEHLRVPWGRFRPGGEARHYAYIVATFLSRDLNEAGVEKALEKVFSSSFGTYRAGTVVEEVDGDLPDTFTDGVPDNPKDPTTSS